tara:strand:+ start:14851 stop:15552 length:702 start_codon:yes stop_codon:yes gene_type:complete
MDQGFYCRDVESYLCRRNDGHLIRIVGPAFELVCTWAQEKIPLSIVFKAIDRVVGRRESSGKVRRPVRIEYCEDDVMDLFREWRRAVGAISDINPKADDQNMSRRLSLIDHLDRVILELTKWHSQNKQPAKTVDAVRKVIQTLDGLRSGAKRATGPERNLLIEELAEIDRSLLLAAWEHLNPLISKALQIEAEEALSAYRYRMTDQVFKGAVRSEAGRLLRERLNFPRIKFES